MFLAEAFEDTYDEQMAPYYSSDEYIKHENQVDAAFNDLIADLPEALHQKLHCFRDLMVDHEASVAVNAYTRGIYVGLCDRREFEKN